MTALVPDDSPARDRPAEPVPLGIGREMAKGMGWTITARFGVQGIGFLSTIILARLLMPSDFGLVALATALAAGLQAISEFSFDVVLIQNQQAGRSQYDTAWTLSVCRNAILAAALAVAAAPVALLFGDPRLQPIVYWLCVMTFLDGFQNIGIIDFRKDLAFHKDLVFMVGAKLAGFVVTVPLAILWRNYWALVAGILATSVVRVALSFTMHGYRPRITFAAWRELMHFSKWLMLNNVCAFFFSRSDTFVLGKIAGAQAVGIYSIGFEIANLVSANMLAPIRRAIFPGFAKVSDNLESLSKYFIDVLAIVMLIGTPATVGIALVAGPLVRIMLGEQWLGAIPVIQVLSISSLLTMLSAGTGPLFLAKARPHYVMWMLGGSSLLMVPLLVVGVDYAGPVGAAWAVAIANAAGIALDAWLVLRLLHLRKRRALAAIWRPLAAVLVMAFAVIELRAFWPDPETMTGWSALLAASVTVGVIVYGIVAPLLWLMSGRPDGAEANLIAALRNSVAFLSRTRSASS
jgi:lipopolysaccharide exporter